MARTTKSDPGRIAWSRTSPIGAWVESVDLVGSYQHEPFVHCPVQMEDPAEALLRWYKGAPREAAIGPGGAWSKSGEEWIADLLEVERALIESGPQACDTRWREMASRHPMPDDDPIELGDFHRGDPYAAQLRPYVFPSMAGMTPVDGALFLIAIARLDRPVPLSFATALIQPSFEPPAHLKELSRLVSSATTRLDLTLDEARTIVLRDKEGDCLLSAGWRPRDRELFPGFGRESIGSEDRQATWHAIEHDGERLVRMSRSVALRPAGYDLPVVELREILGEVGALLDGVRKDAAHLADPARREDAWFRSGASRVVRRIADYALRQWVPWPHPFSERLDAERAMPQERAINEARRLFDRILSALVSQEPPDIAARLIEIVRSGRFPLTAWPEPFEGVWGFKIRTGDHSWLRGTIWRQPDSSDDAKDALSFALAGGWLAPQGCTIQSGPVRCHVVETR